MPELGGANRDKNKKGMRFLQRQLEVQRIVCMIIYRAAPNGQSAIQHYTGEFWKSLFYDIWLDFPQWERSESQIKFLQFTKMLWTSWGIYENFSSLKVPSIKQSYYCSLIISIKQRYYCSLIMSKHSLRQFFQAFWILRITWWGAWETDSYSYQIL